MPWETQDYVPKLQAVKNIVMQPEAFGVTLPEIDNHPFFNTVTIERDMDVSVIALLADVEESEFRALNPAHNRPVVLAAATPQILLPWENAAIFQTNLATFDGPLASWTTWTVPKTMTVTQAADQLKLSENTLRSVNQIPPRMRIVAGSSLLVPRSERHTNDVPEHVATQGRLDLQAEIRMRRITVLARQGETLERLAKRHRADPKVAAWSEHVSARDLFVSVITLQEIEQGLLQLQRRDAAQAGPLRHWFDAQGVDAPQAMAGPRYELFSMQTAAATHGLGMALMPTLLVESELRNGTLVVACDRVHSSGRHYYMVQPDWPERPAMTAFKRSLFTQTG
jgi:DNA-binding transcriptional LysR family regulator